MPEIDTNVWEKLNDFQYRHKTLKDSYIEKRDGIWIYYDKNNTDIVIPIQALFNNPVVSPTSGSGSSGTVEVGSYQDFLDVFENGLL